MLPAMESSGVAVSGVVDREPETVDEVAGGECGAHGDGERFLTDPASAEVFGDLFWGGSALSGERDCGVQGAELLFVTFPAG